MRCVVTFSLLCGLGIGIAGCANPNTKPTHLSFGMTTDAVTMGPALRMVTERPRPIDSGPPLPTICTEPSPDVAIAFGKSLAATGSVTESGGTSGSGSVTATSTETATALAGRTAGVLALRDGLYAACQSYSNGVLGHDAYAVILSQYGNLLVALAGTGTGGNPTTYTSQDAAVGAMLVACLSEHDPTRIRPVAGNGQPITNPLLSLRSCNYLIGQIARGKLLAPPKPAKADTKPANADMSKIKVATAATGQTAAKQPAAGAKVTTTQKTMTKTVTESTTPPAATPPADAKKNL